MDLQDRMLRQHPAYHDLVERYKRARRYWHDGPSHGLTEQEYCDKAVAAMGAMHWADFGSTVGLHVMHADLAFDDANTKRSRTVTATPTGRELDAAIAVALMGWTLPVSPYVWTLTPPAYSSDIAAAWTVLEHLIASGLAEAIQLDTATVAVSEAAGRVGWGACAYANGRLVSVSAATAPEAICRLALLIVAEPVESTR